MNLLSPRNDNTVILIAGTLLGIYVVALIGLAYLKQGYLRESLIQQEQLNAEKQAISVAHFIDRHQAEIDKLTNHRHIRDYLAHHQQHPASGQHDDSKSQDLRSLFTSALTGPQKVDGPFFKNISLIEPNGHVLLRVDNDDDVDPVYTVNDLHAREIPQIRREPQGNLLTFAATRQIDNEVDAVVLAEIETSELVRHFFTEHDADNHTQHTALVGPDDRIIAAGDPIKWHDWRARSLVAKQTVIDVPVSNTTMRIVKLPDEVINQVFLASPLLVGALTVTLLPLFAGVLYLWRLNSHNLVLKTSIQTASKQRALLRAQNRRMQREINRRIESEQKLAHHSNYDQSHTSWHCFLSLSGFSSQ